MEKAGSGKILSAKRFRQDKLVVGDTGGLGKIRLRKHMDVESGFAEIARHCVAQIDANRTQWLEHDFTDGLHQMRVGLRQLRSALALFNSALSLPDDIARELAWLSSVLGPARDWEVFSDSTLPLVVAGDSKPSEIISLQRAVAAIAAQKRQQTQAEVQTPRYLHLIRTLNLWLDTRGWRKRWVAEDSGLKPGLLQKPLAAFLEDGLAKRHHCLSRRGDKLDPTLPRSFHRLRIAVKRARYAAEFSRTFYAPKPMRRYLQRLSDLQDQLGALNDLAVADTLLDELGGGESETANSLRLGIAFVRGYYAALIQRKMENFLHFRLPGKLPALK
ncbi:MAG TPA: CHAD domain-containing protein [Burkholderiaceae bacterium]